MKNLSIVLLIGSLLLLCAAQRPVGVTSISFDRGNTKMVGDININIKVIDAEGRTLPGFANVSSDKQTVFVQLGPLPKTNDSSVVGNGKVAVPEHEHVR